MRIPTKGFSCEQLEEALEEEGMDGQLEYQDGDEKGRIIQQVGTYNFICRFDDNEIELTDLSIGVDGIDMSGL